MIDEMLRIGRECVVTFPNFAHWRCRLQVAARGQMPISKHLPHHWYDTPNIHLCTFADFEALCAAKAIERHRARRLHEQIYESSARGSDFRICSAPPRFTTSGGHDDSPDGGTRDAACSAFPLPRNSSKPSVTSRFTTSSSTHCSCNPTSLRVTASFEAAIAPSSICQCSITTVSRCWVTSPAQTINLLSQRAPLEFATIREGDAIYYIAPIRYTDRDVLRFDLTVSVPDRAPMKLEFQQPMYVESPR